MTAIIIIGILVFILALIGKKKPTTPAQNINNTFNNQRRSNKTLAQNNATQNVVTNRNSTIPSNDKTVNTNKTTLNKTAETKPTTLEKEKAEELTRQILSALKITVTTNSPTVKKDDSIIDVTNNAAYKISTDRNLKKYANGVPYWAHHYVYSYTEINAATNEQKYFYTVFKKSFLNDEYYDLEGNTNYAFILLFDLLHEYDTGSKDMITLQNQLQLLGEHYPKTKPYADSNIIRRTTVKNNAGATISYKIQESSIQNTYNDYDYYKLGSKYKTKLNLNENEVFLLNKLWYPNNNFCNIEFCLLETLKLYLATIKELKNKYVEEGTTLDEQFLSVANIIAKKHFRYKPGSQNYKYSIETINNELYSNIFKYCENAVREHYGHKRKINTDTYYTNQEVKTELETRITSKVIKILPNLVLKLNPPDEVTEIELNSQNTSRWKIKFDEAITNYKGNPKTFVDSMIELGRLNNKNPSVENISFEASKFISKHDKEAALMLYVYYLHYDLKSATFDNKQLTKTIQKNLFKTNEQLHDFGIVISELIKDKNLEKALQAVSKIYAIKRKKIQLNAASIKEVQQQHSGTVELLNEYLQDEYEDESNEIKTQQINNEEVKIEIIQKNDEVQHSIYTNEIAFTEPQMTTLDYFAKSNFSINQSEFEAFAKSKGLFKNQLIESINEACYENLDDILIEEENDLYTINPNYYQRLLAK